MIASVDVDHRDAGAVAACVCFEHWDDSRPVLESAIEINDVEPYEPGQFYRRELPCILAVLRVWLATLQISRKTLVMLDNASGPCHGINMNGYHRRHFLTSTIGAAAAASQWVGSPVRAATQPRERIKVGQIGIGHNHASAKMAAFRKLKDQYEVVGVVEPDLEWRKKRGNEPAYRDLTWMTEEQLLNTEGLVLVAVETDVCDLVSTAARCIDAEMHLHLDKPGGESLGAFHELFDAAERQGLTVQMGYMYRNNPAVQFCLNAVRQGWLGEIFEVHSVMSRLDGAIYRRWLSQFRGGAMYIFGCHLIDLLVAMLGKPDRITPFQRQTLPAMPGRYDDQLIELANIIRGEIANPYPPAHERMVQDALLAASGYPPK